MIAGAHVLLHSKDPETDRAFFKTVLEFPSIDLGAGWLLNWPFIPVTAICANACGASNARSRALPNVR